MPSFFLVQKLHDVGFGSESSLVLIFFSKPFLVRIVAHLRLVKKSKSKRWKLKGRCVVLQCCKPKKPM